MRENTNVRANRRQSSEIQINVSNFEITRVWLIKYVDIHGFVLFNEALDSISYECIEKTGHGSQQSVRNYINSLTSLAAPFELIKKDDKKIIRRKQNHKCPTF